MVAAPDPERDLEAILEALAAPARREILTRVWDHAVASGDLAADLALTPGTVSGHLKILRQAGLVTETRDRNFRRYRARQNVMAGLHTVLFGDSPKWIPADDLPERQLASAFTGRVVVARSELPVAVEHAFRAFVDPEIYGKWLGVPVSIIDGAFDATMEWGTRIRGHYDVVVTNQLIALRWDFEDDNVPVPGGEMVAYMRFVAVSERRARVDVHQLVDSAAHAEFMEIAWSMVLGRAAQGIRAALDPRTPRVVRSPRPKRRR